MVLHERADGAATERDLLSLDNATRVDERQSDAHSVQVAPVGVSHDANVHYASNVDLSAEATDRRSTSHRADAKVHLLRLGGQYCIANDPQLAMDICCCKESS